jgi:hypothetical protein
MPQPDLEVQEATTMQAATIKNQPASDWFSEAHGIMKDIENKLLCPETLRAVVRGPA